MGKLGLLALVSVAVSLGSVGCAAPGDGGSEASATSDTSSSDLSGAKSTECTEDTLTMSAGFLFDLRDSMDASLIHDYGGNYFPHVEIPGFLDAAIAPTDDDGDWFYTIVGFSYGQEDVPAGSKAAPRLVATLSAGPAPANLTFAVRQYEAAKAMFTGLTRGVETTEHHVAPKNSYDRSWDKITRTSKAGQFVCTSTVYPDSGDTRPTYECNFYGFTRNMVQTFDAKDAGNKCLAKAMP
jgi:hypothetical protein